MGNLAGDQVDRLVVRDLDLRGRKTVNAADGKDPKDYVTVGQLTRALTKLFEVLSVEKVDQRVNSYVATSTLTAATTALTIGVKIVDGDFLTYFINQDATGGRLITWDATYFDASTLTGLDLRASKQTIYKFIGYSGKWKQVAIEYPDANLTILAGGTNLWVGTGSPETVVVGTVGDQFIRTDGAAWTTLYLKEVGTGNTGWAGVVTGTAVTSVALAVPGALLTVSGSPVTGSGTITIGLASQNANLAFAGPSSGAAAAPSFRSLVLNDFSWLSTTIVLAKITGGGANGSVTTSNGIVTAYTAPT